MAPRAEARPQRVRQADARPAAELVVKIKRGTQT